MDVRQFGAGDDDEDARMKIVVWPYAWVYVRVCMCVDGVVVVFIDDQVGSGVFVARGCSNYN